MESAWRSRHSGAMAVLRFLLLCALSVASVIARAEDAKPVVVLQERLRFDCRADSIFAFAPDGKSLVLTAGGEIEARDITTGTKLPEWSGRGPRGFVRTNSLAFSQDGRWVATGGDDGTIYVWDAKAAKYKNAIPAHAEAVHEIHRVTRNGTVERSVDETRTKGHEIHSVALSPDGKYVVAASADNSISICDPAAGTVLRRIEGEQNVTAVAFLPDSKTLVSARTHSGPDASTIALWDASTGTLQRRLPPTREEHFGVRYLSLAQHGNLLAGSCGTTPFLPLSDIYLWDLKAGRQLRSITPPDADGCATRVAVSPDGKYVASVGLMKQLSLWATTDGSRAATLEIKSSDHGPELNYVQFSADGKTLGVMAHSLIPSDDKSYHCDGFMCLIDILPSTRGR